MSLLRRLLLVSGLVASTSAHSQTHQNFDFISYFTGKVDGWGVRYDWRGNAVERFHVLMDGKATASDDGDVSLRLDETFTYTSGRTMERYWDIIQSTDGTFTATAPEVPAGVEATFEDSMSTFHYTFHAPLNGKTIKLGMYDRMWKLDDSTVMNKIIMKKFGLKVGEINILFQKRNEG